MFACCSPPRSPRSRLPPMPPTPSRWKRTRRPCWNSTKLAINQKDFEAASKFIGPRYVQHNPRAADGPEGLKAFLAFLREKFPDYHSDIKRVFADGDYVDRPRPQRADARKPRQRHHRHLQARKRQGRRALGRAAGNSGTVRQFQHDVLARSDRVGALSAHSRVSGNRRRERRDIGKSAGSPPSRGRADGVVEPVPTKYVPAAVAIPHRQKMRN